jgi:hypothetical protein
LVQGELIIGKNWRAMYMGRIKGKNFLEDLTGLGPKKLYRGKHLM